MTLNPTWREQDLMVEALERRDRRLTPRERVAAMTLGASYAAVAAAVWATAPPDLGSVSLLAALGVLCALAVAMHIEFDTGAGFTVPSQLAFVPLLFVAPPALVLLAVPLAWAAGQLVWVVRGELRPARLLVGLGNSWFAVGPCLVIALSGAETAATVSAATLLVAFLAQFAGDLGASVVHEALARRATLREQLQDVWVYGVDAALTPAGLLVAGALDGSPWSGFALLPLLGVMRVFAHERRARVEGLVELKNAYRGTALVLGDVVKADDAYTGAHCRAVVSLALAVGERLGLTDDQLRDLEFGALLHDVGKVAIPKEILNKPGRLDPEEWEVMKTHTLEGQHMLNRVGGFMTAVGDIVRSHHERWDGGGYPDNLAGEAIPVEARIIACCDTWNAMTTTRPYREALTEEAAIAELRACSGTQFDPEVARAVLAEVAPEAVDLAADASAVASRPPRPLAGVGSR